MEVGEWPYAHGLGDYAAALRENELDGEILPGLLGEDLRDLGGAMVGHRGKC
jgi:hypothetical protein